jgi:hypothetical protein
MDMVRGKVYRSGVAGPLEIAVVALAAVGLWWLSMGWDWSVVPVEGSPNDYRSPHSGLDYVVLSLAAAAGSAWLGLRGRPVVGAVAVWLPLVLLSGWRMAVAEVIGANLWPIGLAILAAALGVACAAGAGGGAVLHRRLVRTATAT